jgi:plastocyanin
VTRTPFHAARRRCRDAAGAGLVVLAALGMTACAPESEARDVVVADVALGSLVIEPAVLTVEAGDVELRVTNTDVVVHDLVVASKGTRPLQPGQTQVLPLGEIEPGEYRMWCDQPQHAAMGQVGTLVVTPPAAVAPAGP